MIGDKYKKKRRLNIAAIPNCEWWVDVARTETITFSGGTNVSQVRDLSGKNRHMTKTGAGNETIYPVHQPSEKGLLFLNTAYDQMIAGAIGDWNFLHNGNGCTVLTLVKVQTAQAANAVILATSSEAASGVGFNLWYYNTNQNYYVGVRNGTAQTYANSGANNSLLKNSSFIISTHIENRAGNPPDLVTRYNGATDIRTGNLSTYSNANSTGALYVGKLPDAVFKCQMVFKKCAIFSRRLSKAEENLILEAWAREESISLTRYGERALAVIGGQSNAKGRGLISETPYASTPTVTNARIFNNSGFTWANLAAGTTNDAYSASHLGMEMNLATQFIALSGKNLDIAKYAADGTAMTSWDNLNSNFINLQSTMQRALWELEDAGYTVKPFFIWYQGETDALDNTLAAAYGGRLQTFITQMLNIPGFQQTPTYIVQIMQSPTQTGTVAVQNAGMTTAMTTPYSAYVRFVEIADIATNLDTNHINAVSLSAVGMRIAKRYLGIAE